MREILIIVGCVAVSIGLVNGVSVLKSVAEMNADNLRAKEMEERSHEIEAELRAEARAKYLLQQAVQVAHAAH